jgi:hypothetical protein
MAERSEAGGRATAEGPSPARLQKPSGLSPECPSSAEFYETGFSSGLAELAGLEGLAGDAGDGV